MLYTEMKFISLLSKIAFFDKCAYINDTWYANYLKLLPAVT